MMDKLKMHSADIADEKFRKLAALFPEAVTETVDSDGNVVRAIDKDVLTEEINRTVVDGLQERYQFTWPDKRKARNLANTPTTKTLRLIKEKSVGRDGKIGGVDSENIYIEGDNLDALKILRETYLGKVKMIYIDPPYNTGGDFIYRDNFAKNVGEYAEDSGQFNFDGNRMVENVETNGRFHTDWLNMIYPRLKLAKDFLTEDGVAFVSIDYNENFHLREIMNEVFGESNFVGEIYWESKTKSQNTKTSYNKLQPKVEMILVYSKAGKKRFNLIKKSDKSYPLKDEKGIYREYQLEVMNADGVRGRQSMIFDITVDGIRVSPPSHKQWQMGIEQITEFQNNGDLFIRDNKPIIKMRPQYERQEMTEPFWGFFPKNLGTTESAKKELTSIIGNHGFETVKPVEVVRRLIYHASSPGDIIMDFFSGSATTANAVLLLNAESKINRKFILIQEEGKEELSDFSKRLGFESICDLGETRIRKSGNQIQEQTNVMIDYGFRCFKVDSSNMKNIYYNPSDYDQDMMNLFADNIKMDRTPVDLLIQVMLDLGILISSKIEKTVIFGKEVFSVANGYLLACFDKDITDEVVRNIAEKHPYYAVFRDYSMATDSVAVNFDQIFNTYSPKTIRKVL